MKFIFKLEGDIMRTADGYKTRQRAVIENILKDNSDIHMTVDDIAAKLISIGENVGRTTVYRTLEKLVNEGKVRKYTAEKNDSACFQYLTNTGHCHEHFHLKCVDCGKLLHLDCQKISELASHIASDHGFTLNAGRTVLYGVCEKCRLKG